MFTGGLPSVSSRVDPRGALRMSCSFSRKRPEEHRRSRRAQVSWRGAAKAHGRTFALTTVNVSDRGAKVRMEEPLREGTSAHLRLYRPGQSSMDVSAVVCRIDADGVAFQFLEDR